MFEKLFLCLFVIALSICVCPIFLWVPAEIRHVFGLVEVDLFSWYRMVLVGVAGILLLMCHQERIPKIILLYWALVVASTSFSWFIRTSTFGAPWNHEGAIAILGYIGLYLAARKYGMFSGLEKSFDIVIIFVFLVGIIQMFYGNFIGWLNPTLEYEAIRWPMYSTLGNQNHLGLFSVLFLPYAYCRKKYVLLSMVLIMLICNESRGAWAAALVTTLFMGRRALLLIALACLLIFIPFYRDLSPRITGLISSVHFPVRDVDLGGRGYMWKRALPVMKQTLLIGKGPGTFGLHIPQRTQRGTEAGFKGLIVDRPHNMFVNIWTGTGLLSLIVLLYGVLWVMWNGTNPGLELGVLAFLICGLTTDSVLSVTPYFVIFLGILAHSIERKDENNEKGRNPKGIRRTDTINWTGPL